MATASPQPIKTTPTEAPAPHRVNAPVGMPKAPLLPANDEHVNDNARPPHTHVESSMAPTGDFWRNITTALFARYTGRGGAGLAFSDPELRPQSGIGKKIMDFLGTPGDYLNTKHKWDRKRMEAATYSSFLGIGSLLLTTSYSLTVYKDIKNIFSETVAAELGKPVDKVNFSDISRSENKIVQVTVKNFWSKMIGRLATDLLFFPAAFLRHASAGDAVLGVKGVQLFLDTWKRKVTLFEDLVTFVNNKINPRNGIGQPISMGEVFDLYQHYEEKFHPEKMFGNVLERGTGEGAIWAKGQPVFQRMTDLMNQTYAYKHLSVLDTSGHAVRQADFPLPKFIYLLGHDLIDPAKPEQTLAMIEIANARGIPAVKEAGTMLAQGNTIGEVTKRFGITLPSLTPKIAHDEKNGVIAKGNTVQIDAAPVAKIDASSVRDYTAPETNVLLARH